MLHFQPFLDMAYVTFRVPSKEASPSGSSRRTTIERDAPFPEPSFVRLSKSPVNEPPPSNGVPMDRVARFQSLLLVISRSLLYTRSPHKTISPSFQRSPHSMVRQPDPCGERCSVCRAIGLFIHSYLSVSQFKELTRGKTWSPSMEPHAGGGPTHTMYIQWDAAWFHMGPFTTLLLLLHFIAAFSIVPSTLAWVY